MCFIYDGDGYLVGKFTDRVVTARKSNVCVECRGSIAPKQPYYLQAFMWVDGRQCDFVVDRWCLSCQSLRSQIAKQEEERGCSGQEAWPPSGELWDALRSGDYEGVKGWFGFYRRCTLARTGG